MYPRGVGICLQRNKHANNPRNTVFDTSKTKIPVRFRFPVVDSFPPPEALPIFNRRSLISPLSLFSNTIFPNTQPSAVNVKRSLPLPRDATIVACAVVCSATPVPNGAPPSSITVPPRKNVSAILAFVRLPKTSTPNKKRN